MEPEGKKGNRKGKSTAEGEEDYEEDAGEREVVPGEGVQRHLAPAVNKQEQAAVSWSEREQRMRRFPLSHRRVPSLSAARRAPSGLVASVVQHSFLPAVRSTAVPRC